MPATNSFKLICPHCYRSVRATRQDVRVICAYCNAEMKFAPSYDYRRPAFTSARSLPEKGGAADG